jgi:hypothetical protein
MDKRPFRKPTSRVETTRHRQASYAVSEPRKSASKAAPNTIEALFYSSTHPHDDLSASYFAVWKSIPTHLRSWSSRFLRYLTIMSVPPAEASDVDLDAFLARARSAKITYANQIEKTVRKAATAMRELGRPELALITPNPERIIASIDQLERMAPALRADFERIVGAFANPLGEASRTIRTDDKSVVLFALHEKSPELTELKPMKKSSIISLRNQILVGLKAAQEAGLFLETVLDLFEPTNWRRIVGCNAFGKISEPSTLRSKILERGRTIASWQRRSDRQKFIQQQLQALPKRRGGISATHLMRLEAFDDEKLARVGAWVWERLGNMGRGAGDLHEFRVAVAIFLFMSARLTQPQILGLSFIGACNRSGRPAILVDGLQEIEGKLPAELIAALDKAWPFLRLKLRGDPRFWPVKNPETNTTCGIAISKLGKTLGVGALTIKLLQDVAIHRLILEGQLSIDDLADAIGVTQIRNLQTRFDVVLKQAASRQENTLAGGS